jgi:hypothetical protein
MITTYKGKTIVVDEEEFDGVHYRAYPQDEPERYMLASSIADVMAKVRLTIDLLEARREIEAQAKRIEAHESALQPFAGAYASGYPEDRPLAIARDFPDLFTTDWLQLACDEYGSSLTNAELKRAAELLKGKDS